MIASAPGKLMLFGEYAVLEGHRALAMCLDRRIRCTATRGGDRLRIDAPGVFDPPIDVPAAALAEATPPDDRLRLLWPILRAHLDGTGARLTFDAGFPPTWGLGSSSASTLAAAAALAGAADPAARFAEVRAAQRALQGAASGYDVATQLLGGYVAYRDGDPAAMERVEPGCVLRWVVAYTGVKVKTGPMIGRVRERFPPGDAVYAEIGALAEHGIDRLVAGDRVALGRALNDGHDLLRRLGAVPDDLHDRVVSLRRSTDVIGARMTGAGGGDCVLVLAANPLFARVVAEEHGFEVLDLHPEPEGLRLEA